MLDPRMTFDQAQTRYRLYLGLALLSLSTGLLIMIVTLAKTIYYATDTSVLPGLTGPLHAFIDQLYGSVVLVRLLWGAVPADGAAGSQLLLNPLSLSGMGLIAAGGALRSGSARFRSYLVGAREHHRMQSIRDSLQARGRRGAQSQSIGTIESGGNVTITQQVQAPEPAGAERAPTTILMTIAAGVAAAIIAQLINVLVGLSH